MTGLLSRYCVECHGSDTSEANVRIDQLDVTGGPPPDAALLDRMLRVISGGAMPPEDAVAAPTADERVQLVSWVKDRLEEVAHAARHSWTRNRRLTVDEYNFTMQELFDVDAEFADLLLPDPLSEAGYRNDSRRLGLSSLQVETYIDSARRAVDRYVQFGPLDQQPLRYHIEFEKLFYANADRYRTRDEAPKPVDADTFAARRAANLAAPPGYVDPLGPKLAGAHSDDERLRAAIPKLNQQYIAIPARLTMGELIIRVRAAGTPDRTGRFPRMRVEAGITLGDGCSMNKRILGEADVKGSIDQPETYEFRMRLEDVPTKGPLREEDAFDRLSVFDMDQIFISNVSDDARAIFALGRGGYADPATGSSETADALTQMTDDGCNLLHLDALEIEMVPGADKQNRPYRWRVAMVAPDNPGDELAVAREMLQSFMHQAYRRPVDDGEVAAKLELYRTLRNSDHSFEQSLREALAAVLVSPSFLFLEPNAPADVDYMPTAHQLASRLSYLLWLSPPDASLMRRAGDGSVLQGGVLRSEAERLLADARSRRYLESFCRQWLRLDKHSTVSVSRDVYPTYDDDLAADSIRETVAYFVEVFESDASALDLIDSKYAVLNDRLAGHYGVEGVKAGQFRRVELPENSFRGGLLTQASLLTINSDGVDSHPIRRGVWLLERLLNSPPPPPPPNVPAIDEDDPRLRGLTLKERIAHHRQPGACQNCHRKIDPWGIAFENFDATGRWRETIASTPENAAETRLVDSATILPDGQPISGILELKTYLRNERRQQFADALVHHLLTYTLGRKPDYLDRHDVEQIQERFIASNYRLRELVLAIIQSPSFRASQ